MVLRQKGAWSLLGAILLAALLALPALAQDHGDPGKGGWGKITAVSSTTITVQPRKGDPKTFTITASTTVTLDRKTATVGDLKEGQFAKVSSTDGTTATAIDAGNHHRRGNGQAPPAGGNHDPQPAPAPQPTPAP